LYLVRTASPRSSTSISWSRIGRCSGRSGAPSIHRRRAGAAHQAGQRDDVDDVDAELTGADEAALELKRQRVLAISARAELEEYAPDIMAKVEAAQAAR
jgi:hypothetical protein